jgi:hypothetical protein
MKPLFLFSALGNASGQLQASTALHNDKSAPLHIDQDRVLFPKPFLMFWITEKCFTLGNRTTTP